MLPLLIYVTVSRTASLSQSADTTCVCNECVYVACVCVCVSACFFCKREHLCLLYCTCADAGDVMLFVRVSKCVCVCACVWTYLKLLIGVLFNVFNVCVCFIRLGRKRAVREKSESVLGS